MLERLEFRGENLRIARDYCGRTLEEIGNRVNVKKQYIQQLEAGKRQPSEDLVAALSVAVNCRPGFFSRKLTHKVELEACHFRRPKSLLNYHLDWFAAHATLFLHLLDFLDERLGLPPYKVPSIAVSTDADIEDAAEECRSVWGIPANAPIRSVARVTEGAGVPIANSSGISDKLDAFSWSRGRPIIVRNLDKNSGSRSRFDLAHELGHLVMHRSEKPGQERVEKQAHRFAGAFLFPKDPFIKEFPKSGWLDWPKLLQLKARWGVSLAALVKRAYDLGLIDAARYHWAHVDLNCRGWKVCEPEELPLEETELMPRAFEHLRVAQRVVPQQVAMHLDLEPVMLQRISGLPIPTISLAT